MRLSRHYVIQLLLGTATLLLASILVFLYIKSSTDQTSRYTESRDLIRQMQQLNAQWDSEVLKARIALTHNYDPLVTPLTQITRIWEELRQHESYHAPNDLPGWQASLDAGQAAIQDKARLSTSSSPITPYCATPWHSCRPLKTISRPRSHDSTTNSGCHCKAWPPTPMTCCSAAWSSPRSPVPTARPRFCWA